MSKRILFSLEECMKCVQTKQLLSDRDDVSVITLPHDISDWDENQLQTTKTHEVFEELQRTAPILWDDGEKHIGYLRIRKWIQDTQP